MRIRKVKPFSRLRHPLRLALGGVNCDAATLLQRSEFLCWDHPGLRQVRGKREDPLCCATLGGKQTGTKGRDGQRRPTCQRLEPSQRTFLTLRFAGAGTLPIPFRRSAWSDCTSAGPYESGL